MSEFRCKIIYLQPGKVHIFTTKLNTKNPLPKVFKHKYQVFYYII